jgi:hypothetical protein
MKIITPRNIAFLILIALILWSLQEAGTEGLFFVAYTIPLLFITIIWAIILIVKGIAAKVVKNKPQSPLNKNVDGIVSVILGTSSFFILISPYDSIKSIVPFFLLAPGIILGITACRKGQKKLGIVGLIISLLLTVLIIMPIIVSQSNTRKEFEACDSTCEEHGYSNSSMGLPANSTSTEYMCQCSSGDGSGEAWFDLEKTTKDLDWLNLF